ncbi:MAG: putative RNA pseudouridine synthase [Calditrichaeota bacterium]|nr:putative RNA pseudouridine synthase [Calditrichota bacterium]
MNPGSTRLDSLLSRRGVASRRQSAQIVKQGRVTVDGAPVREPGFRLDPERARVEVDGAPLPEPKLHLYLALNKPPGVLSSFRKDRETGATLAGLVPHERRLFTAGRLDRDSSGLLLLTTDGGWANRVMHPHYEKEKEYHVRFANSRPGPAAEKMRRASFVEQGRTFRCALAEPAGAHVRIVLKEGRKRQIRRLARDAGLRVKELVRVRIGDVRLGSLAPGRYRELSEREVRSLGR